VTTAAIPDEKAQQDPNGRVREPGEGGWVPIRAGSHKGVFNVDMRCAVVVVVVPTSDIEKARTTARRPESTAGRRRTTVGPAGKGLSVRLLKPAARALAIVDSIANAVPAQPRRTRVGEIT
jgi:hypothetical protein